MKIIALLTLLLAGCSVHHYQPTTQNITIRHDTYAPVYAPTTTTTTYPQAQKKAAKKTIVRIIPGGAK